MNKYRIFYDLVYTTTVLSFVDIEANTDNDAYDLFKTIDVAELEEKAITEIGERGIKDQMFENANESTVNFIDNCQIEFLSSTSPFSDKCYDI